MNSSIRKISFTLVFVVTAIGLGGCLSDSGSITDNGSGGTNPPSSNNAPTISGSPSAFAVISNAYSFAPTATDSDGDTLTFSAQNMPNWAQFSTSTGAMTGAPTLAAIGSYPNISISVSDGQASSSLPGFSVDVVQNANGSITLTWTPPTRNSDGSMLTDLAAYKFYYGTSSGNYSGQVLVSNPGIAMYVIGNLAPATYYVVATAVNTAGFESGFSNETVKLVP